MDFYKTKVFRRFQRKERISDADLLKAISRAEMGLIDADLGRGLIKQRIARKGEGRRGGYRTIIAYRAGARAFFMYGFAKNERDNIAVDDERDMVETGATLQKLGTQELKHLIDNKELWEIVP